MGKHLPGAVRDFAGAVYGGAAVAIGATAYFSADNKAVGAFLFSIGLFMIYTFGFQLYTGKVCDLPARRPGYILYLLLVIAGNAAGACGTGWLLRLTRLSHLSEKAAAAAAVKLEQPLFSAFILAALCGVMMCTAVKGFESIQNGAGKYFALVVPVMVFLFAGFEHSIANFFYFSLAGAWSLKAAGYMAVFILGNAAGGVLIPLLPVKPARRRPDTGETEQRVSHN